MFPLELLIEQGLMNSILLIQSRVNLELNDAVIQEVVEESFLLEEEHVEVKAEIVAGIGNEIRLSIVRPEDMSEEGSKDTLGGVESELKEVGAMSLLGAVLVVAVEYSD